MIQGYRRHKRQWSLSTGALAKTRRRRRDVFARCSSTINIHQASLLNSTTTLRLPYVIEESLDNIQ